MDRAVLFLVVMLGLSLDAHAGWFGGVDSSKYAEFAGLTLGSSLPKFTASESGKKCKETGREDHVVVFDCSNANTLFDKATLLFFEEKLMSIAITFKGHKSTAIGNESKQAMEGVLGKFGKEQVVVPYQQSPIGDPTTKIQCNMNTCRFR